MPAGANPDTPGAAGAPGPNLWQKLLLHLPRLKHRSDKPTLGDRFQRAVLKPVDPAKAPAPRQPGQPTLEELDAARLSDDQERLIGLSIAPLAGLIAILVSSHQLADNPAATLANGQPNPLHVGVGVVHELELVLLALAVAILVTSLLRKRMYTGIVTALYGLAIFNLHWWGFGIPFVMIGAWFLVRAYRAQQAYKAAVAEAGGGGPPGTPPPRANKRYTPPTTSPKRLPRPKPNDERNAG